MKPVSKAVGNRRLLKLADLLEKVPKERFDVKYWVGGNWKGEPDLSCGTTACALGWATTIPSLRKAGLVLKRADNFSSAHVAIKGEEDASIYSHECSVLAGAKVFGISRDESYDLFMATADYIRLPTSKQMAELIREFVKGRS